MPNVELMQRKQAVSFSRHHNVHLDCLVSANPLDRVDWYRNGQLLSAATTAHHESDKRDERSFDDELDYRIDTHDLSDLNELFRTQVTLTIIVSLFRADINLLLWSVNNGFYFHY